MVWAARAAACRNHMIYGVNNAHMSRFAVFMAASLAVVLLRCASSSGANVYLEPNLKPLRHVCGVVVDKYNRPIPKTKVVILKGGREISGVRTGEDGKFSFEHLAADRYEIRAEAIGFHPESFHIVLVKPKTPTNQMLRIRLSVGTYEGPDIRIVKSR